MKNDDSVDQMNDKGFALYRDKSSRLRDEFRFIEDLKHDPGAMYLDQGGCCPCGSKLDEDLIITKVVLLCPDCA